MPIADVAPEMQKVLDRVDGETIDQKLVHLLISELRRRLQECEGEILELEIKHGLMYDEFQARLQAGELGDPFSYPLEQDAMRWDDLMAEKEHWLSQIRSLQGMS
jgi:hypothetical protein